MRHRTTKGRKKYFKNTRGRHQNQSVGNDNLQIESTNLIGTSLMDLNDDCLSEIFTLLTVMDLCSLFEVSEATKNERLKSIINDVFKRNHTICRSITSPQRLLTNFGPLISDLSISSCNDRNIDNRTIETLTRCCNGTLKSLELSNFTVDVYEPNDALRSLEELSIDDCHFESNAANLFASCDSLVKLSVYNDYYDDSACTPETDAMYRLHFPQLQSFSGGCNCDNFKYFFSRHTKIQNIRLASSQIPIIADYCSDVKTLMVPICSNDRLAKIKRSVKSISSFKNLEKFIIDDEPSLRRAALTYIRQLRHVPSLKTIMVYAVRCTDTILTSLSQLEMLEELDFLECSCKDDANFNVLAKLCRLRKLSMRHMYCTAALSNFDLAYLISRLNNLEEVILNSDLKIDKEMESEINDARLRSGLAHPALTINCNKISKTIFPLVSNMGVYSA